MSMNKYMHPRNIYKSPPDFKQLAIDYPEFREYVQQDITGKITLNFKDLKALRALSSILLKKDFSLDVEMPLNKLIPTIPLRLNYILWIEDLLSLSGKLEKVRGIDIGTGASCVYPLIAAKKNQWTMLATETDSESIRFANQNVARNELQDLITIVAVNADKLIEHVVADGEFTFCMCNPPFFSCTQELHPFFKARKSNRPHPKNAFCASITEVVSKGGEVEFILKLIQESQTLRKNITIYSTMIGHKSSLPPLKKALRDASVHSFKESEFCQGNTTRWGLAWTFHDIDLRKAPDKKSQLVKAKPKPALIYVLPSTDVNEYSLNYVSEKLLQMFKELQMVTEEVSRNKTALRYYVTAYSNTWSHQRRKRREQEKKLDDSNEMDSSLEEAKSDTSSQDNNNVPEGKLSSKRVADGSFDGSLLKKLKITSANSAKESVFLKFMLAIRSDLNHMYLELESKGDSNDRETLHQILQYIKNHLKV